MSSICSKLTYKLENKDKVNYQIILVKGTSICRKCSFDLLHTRNWWTYMVLNKLERWKEPVNPTQIKKLLYY